MAEGYVPALVATPTSCGRLLSAHAGGRERAGASSRAEAARRARRLVAASPSADSGSGGTWPAARRFIAGYFSGCALVLAGHPFDTIKTRMQVEGTAGRFKGPLDAVMSTARNEGLAAFYKGVTPPLLMTGGVNFLLFGIQGLFVDLVKGDRKDPTPADVAMAAVPAGAVLSVVVAPSELLGRAPPVLPEQTRATCAAPL